MGVIISDKDTINVYKFMEMCGLKCKIKKNVKVSHTIMMKKLNLRNKLFPEQVVVPKKINRYDINNEDVKRGNIVLVKDDYDKRTAYQNPISLDVNVESYVNNMTERERKRVRKALLKEYKRELEESTETLKEGYIKYLVRKQNKEEKEEVVEEIEEDEQYVLEHQSRIRKYPNHGFGRR